MEEKINDFIKLDALIDFYISEETGTITVSLPEICGKIDSYLPNLSYNEDVWTEVLSNTIPRLNNVITLLKEEEFRKIKFPRKELIRLALLLDEKDLITTTNELLIELSVFFDSLSVFQTMEEIFPSKCSYGVILMKSIGKDKYKIFKHVFSKCTEEEITKALPYIFSSLNFDLCDFTLEKGYKPLLDNYYFLHEVITLTGESFKYIFELPGLDLSPYWDDIIRHIILKRSLTIVEYLYSKRVGEEILNAIFRKASDFMVTKIVDFLIDKEEITSESLAFALSNSTGRGELTLVKRLCQSPKTDPTYMNNISLRVARNLGRKEVVQYLLSIESVRKLDSEQW